MIVASRRRFVSHPSVLVEGHLYSVDSGMGGSWTVKYLGKEDGLFVFVRADIEDRKYKYTHAELMKEVYILPPENVYDEICWDIERSKKLRHSKMYGTYWGWYPPEVGRISYAYLQTHGLLPNHWKVGERVYWYRDGVCEGIVTEVTRKGLVVGEKLISYGGAFRSSEDVLLRLNAS